MFAAGVLGAEFTNDLIKQSPIGNEELFEVLAKANKVGQSVRSIKFDSDFRDREKQRWLLLSRPAIEVYSRVQAQRRRPIAQNKFSRALAPFQILKRPLSR
jgi:hypothetical protein